MGSFTLNPDSTVSVGAGDWAIQGGAASHHAALADASDSTASRAKLTAGAAPGSTLVTLASATLPTDAQVRSVVPYVRMRLTNSSLIVSGLFTVNVPIGTTQSAAANSLVPTSALAEYAGSPLPVTPDGAAWTQTGIDALRLELAIASGTFDAGVDFAKAWIVVNYNERPVTTVTTSGTVTSSTPTLGGTYTDPENDRQERAQWAVFTSAYVAANGGGSFDPTVQLPYAAWTSGEVITDATTVAITTALTNGETYTAFFRAADQGASPVRWSAWASSSFTLAVTPPAVPNIAATAQSADARVKLDIFGHDNMLTTNQASAETDTTGIAAKSNCSVDQVTTQAKHGTGSFEMTAAAAGDMEMDTSPDTVEVVASMEVTARVSSRANTTARSFRVDLRFKDAGGSVLATSIGTPVANSSANFNAEASVTGTAPANTTQADMVVRVLSAAAGEKHCMDQLAIAPGDAAETSWTRGGLADAQRLYAERSSDGGTSWAHVRDVQGLDLSNPQQVGTVYDYEAARGVELRYRVQTRAVEGASTLVSDWSAIDTETLSSDGEWWIKAPEDSSLNTTFDVQAPHQITWRESQAVFYPKGRDRAVVLHGDLYGEDGTLNIEMIGQAEWDALVALRNLQTTLLLQDPFGGQWYIDIGEVLDPSLTHASGDVRTRTVRIPYFHVDAPD